MMQRKKCIAIKLGALPTLLLVSQLALAEPAGVVSDSTGPLLARSASGSIKVLAAGSSVDSSDTLISRPGVYARVILTDHSDLALGPDTELSIEKYSYHDKDSPPNTVVLRLSKGSVRVNSGVLGTRDTDTFTLAAGQATIAIHHSVFVATYIQQTQGELGQRDNVLPPAFRTATLAISGHTLDVAPAVVGPPPRMYDSLLAGLARSVSGNQLYVRVAAVRTQSASPLELTDSPIRLAQNAPAPGGATNPGLYVQVLDGLINVSNGGGSQNFAAGQFGYTPNFNQPPVIVPANPAIQFTPPPQFSAPTSGSQGGSGKPGTVDCVVR